MRKLSVFNNVSLDGYFVDAQGEMGWARKQDAEWQAFTAGNARGGGAMLFGRVTYDLMAGFWPTPMAMQTMPDVATAMNKAEKIVFSRKMAKAEWNNTRVVRDDIAGQIARLKAEPGGDMVIFGSGSIVAQFTQAGLIDEFQIALSPIVLGAGRTMFESVTTRPELKRTECRTFANGVVFLRYEKVR